MKSRDSPPFQVGLPYRVVVTAVGGRANGFVWAIVHQAKPTLLFRLPQSRISPWKRRMTMEQSRSGGLNDMPKRLRNLPSAALPCTSARGASGLVPFRCVSETIRAGYMILRPSGRVRCDGQWDNVSCAARAASSYVFNYPHCRSDSPCLDRATSGAIGASRPEKDCL